MHINFYLRSSYQKPTRKYPEIIDPLCKDEGSKASDFQKPFYKPSLYTRRVYNNIVGMGEVWVSSSKTEKTSSAVLLAEASKGK